MARKTDDQIANEQFETKLQQYKLDLKLIYEKSQDAFEKQLSYLSAGALGFSILFVERTVGEISSTVFTWTLVLSWALLTFTLTANLISHWLAARNMFKSIREIDEGEYDHYKVNRRIKKVTFINIATIVSFFLGILCLVTFVIVNIMSDSNKPRTGQKGHVPTSAPQHPRPNTGQTPIAPPVKPPVKNK